VCYFGCGGGKKRGGKKLRGALGRNDVLTMCTEGGSVSDGVVIGLWIEEGNITSLHNRHYLKDNSVSEKQVSQTTALH